jgi:uncharacterized protein (TIGR02147 family)
VSSSKEKISEMVSVYDYTDVHEYLKAAIAYLNEISDGKYSYRFIANQLKVSSKTTIGRILNRERRSIPQQLVKGFSRLLKHNKGENLYFETMVRYCESRSLKDKNEYYDKLMHLPRPVKKAHLQRYQYDFFKEWFISVIRELITMYPFDGDYKALAARLRPKISEEQARHAVKVLEKLDMITLAEDGWYQQTETAVSSQSEVRNMALLQHQLQHMELTRQALRLNQQENDYKISTATFGVNEEGFKEIIKRVSDFQREIVDIMAKYDDKMDKVYQFNMFLYPLSERTEGKESRKKKD